MKDNFKVKWTADKYGPEALLFGDFLDLNAGEFDRFYRCVRDPKQLSQVLEVKTFSFFFISYTKEPNCKIT